MNASSSLNSAAATIRWMAFSKPSSCPIRLRGAIFAACRGRVVLADDMGLGKTVQALAAAELLRRRRGIERVLVVAPASVKYQWKTEIEKVSDTVQMPWRNLCRPKTCRGAEASFFPTDGRSTWLSRHAV